MNALVRFFYAVPLLVVFLVLLAAKVALKTAVVAFLLLAAGYPFWLWWPAPEPVWEVAPGYTLEEDATGFMGPVDIAFVPDPATGPEAPLYLVSELRGAIKAVLRNREVRLFARYPGTYQAKNKLPKAEGSYGLHGLCFSPDGRHLFSTSVYLHEGVPKNRITRWESVGTPRWAQGRPVATLDAPFRNGQAGGGHMVGNCFVDDWEKLWVGMGDGLGAPLTHDPDSAVGKLYRINLDFTAPEDNPFYDPKRPGATRNFVFATGFRNPWALTQTPWGEVIVAGNGPQVDRMVVVRRGFDYPWDGTNTSMTYNALLVWPQAVAPVDMFFAGGQAGVAGLTSHLVVTSSKLQQVLVMPYVPGKGIRGRPVPILARAKASYQTESLTGIAPGPDGIYVLDMTYGGEEFFHPSPVLRLVPVPGAQNLGQGIPRGGQFLFQEMGCGGCHKLGGKGGETGPNLDGLAARVAKRLEDGQYFAQLKKMGGSGIPGGAAENADLAAVLEGPPEGRVAAWTRVKLAVPNFDNPKAQMPKLPLTPGQVKALADFLLHNP